MADEFLKNPASLFDVKGKTAIVTGASGAFGALAAKVLAGAGANVVLAASKQDELEEGRRRMRGARRQGRGRRAAPVVGGKLRQDRRRPRSTSSAASTSWWSPPASTRCRRSSTEARGFPRRHGRQRQPVLADGARRRPADAQAGQRRQGDPDLVGARAARPSGRLHRLLRLEVRGRRHHQGARLRMGRDRHHRQRDRADGLPLAADRVDVRGQRASARPCARASSRACRRAAWASRKISRGRCCSWRRRRRTSTPATSSTPTAAIRRGKS